MSIHVLPVNDIEDHEEFSTCKCEPKVIIENGEMIIIHNSFDYREIIEQTREILKMEEKELWLEYGKVNPDGFEDVFWYNEGEEDESADFLKKLIESKDEKNMYFKVRYGTEVVYLRNK